MFAKAVLENYDGKIVVMTWEHNRIANDTKGRRFHAVYAIGSL